MSEKSHQDLSRRERQIMDIIYRKGSASVSDVLEAIPDPPSYSAVRAMLRILEEKGQLSHKREGRKYVFLPTVAREKAGRFALRNLLTNFFDGSVEETVASLLDMRSENLSDEDLARLSQLIERARNEERRS